MKRIVNLLFILAFVVSCQKKEEAPVVVVPKIPEVTNLSGGILKIKATDDYKEIVTEIITDSSNNIIPDGTYFRAVSDTLAISDDRIDWVQDLLVYSVDGVIKVSVKPATEPGLYRVTLYPISSETLTFTKNLNSRFFVEVTAGTPYEIKSISSERYEDLSPYNGVKDLNEPWIVSADPDLTTYLSVGPINDKFGNAISSGTIQLTVSDGSVVSTNPATISSGFAYFSYRPISTSKDLTVTAVLSDSAGTNLIKNTSMKLTNPVIEFMDTGDFSDMLDGETRDLTLRVRNSGSQAATNLSINISAPFLLLAEQSDSCKDRGSLKSQETCKIRIRYTRQTALTQNGFLQIIGQPSNFVTSTATTPLIVNNVEPANLILSESSITFPNTSCGLSNTKEVYVTNTGTYPATNINVTQPTSTVVGQAPYFKIILPPPDSAPSPNYADVINCGTTFPSGRRCRVFLEFLPLSIFPATPVTGLINADSIPSLAISMSGAAVPGQPSGDIPITFYKSGTTTPTSTMFAQNGQRTTVRVGPIADSCGNPVANGTMVGATVTGGTLNTIMTSTNQGISEFTWNALSKPELLGNQTITVISNGYSKQSTLTFQGVNLTLSGPTDLGQVVIERPTNFVYTLQNTGNIRADNISFSFNQPLVLVDLGTCAAGVSVNQSCTFTVGARPTQNLDYNTSIFGSSGTPGINTPFLSGILVMGRGKPVITFDSTKYLFNDGLASGSVSRTMTITNTGPAISKNTQVSVTSPYTIISNSCPTTLAVNASCSVTVSVPRNSALGAGYKSISVSNEVETTTSQAVIGYAELKFGTQAYTYKKYYCTGPFTVSAIGINGVAQNISQNTNIDLSSNTGKVLFYSESTCNTKITNSLILANASVSNQFYLRSIAAETNLVQASSGSIPGDSRSFTFDDIRNDILTFKPALAVQNTACILCHSNIQGNIVTDFQFNATKYNMVNVPGVSGSGDELMNDSYYTGITGGGSGGYGTSYIEGRIYVPKLNIGTETKNIIQPILANNKPSYYDSATPTVVNTVAEYLNAILPHRTTAYLNILANYIAPANEVFTKDGRINPRNISIREVNSVFIGAPAANKITSFLDALGTFKYYKWDDTVSYELTNFQKLYDKFYGNIPGIVTQCDGDIFIDGTVFLKEFRVRTISGCRIYATGVVFIQAPAGTSTRDGIEFVDITSTSNIQISSAVGISLGLDAARMNVRIGKDSPNYPPNITTMIPDAVKISDQNGTSLLQDASDSGNRSVSFSRILLNAPRVDSRYQGDFKGVIIAKHSIWSLGHFSYFYDPIFDSIPILPFFEPSSFFSVEDCVVNNVDQSIIKDSQTNFRSCSPN